ncbi:MAG: flagellar hook assembly protein FlgD [Firmicutes bacterium]|nr:flagellar hook assembly protein FlgD [Bacillota bacterium]
METSMVTSATQNAAALGTKAAPKKDLDKDSFLRLLVAQMQNQDPTQAQDPNQMVQQMTSFSSLEQMQNMNKLLEGIQVQNQGLFQAQSANLVGKRVRASSTGFDLKSGQASLGVDLAADAQVQIAVKDGSGKVVAVLDQGSMKAGSHTVTWNGRNELGQTLPDGAYTVEITAKGSTGQAVEAKPSTFVTVDSVMFLNGTVLVQAGGRRFNLADINQIFA